MRFITALVASGLAIILLPSAVGLAQSPNHQWIRVTTDNYDNTYRLDKQVGGRGRYRRYWMSVVLAGNDESYKWKKVLSSIDCQTFQRRIRMTVRYEASGKIYDVANDGGGGDVENVPRKSIEGRIANIACSLK